MLSMGLTSNKNHYLHDSLLNGFPSPGSPSRLLHILGYLSENGLTNNGTCDHFESEPARIADILRVSTNDYIATIESSAENAKKYLGKLVDVIFSGMQDQRSVADDIDPIELLAARSGNIRQEFDEKLAKLKLILAPYWQLNISDSKHVVD
jgi:acetoin utilization deacetylase AcuC-like enzyme